MPTIASTAVVSSPAAMPTQILLPVRSDMWISLVSARPGAGMTIHDRAEL